MEPSAYEQYLLELINADRAQVGAQPLAPDGDLNEAAQGHSQWMIATDAFSHTGAGGSSPGDRMRAAGYAFTGSWANGENIAWASTRAPAGYQDEVLLLHTNLMNSPGHRANILNDTYREIGLGYEIGEYQGREGAFVTENFARSGAAVFLTGVAFDDRDGDRFYDVGEGLGGLAVTAVNDSTGARAAAVTMSAGGYDLALGAGTYTVTFTGADIAPVTRQVTIGGKNLKLDLVDPAAPPPQSGDGLAQDVNADGFEDVRFQNAATGQVYYAVMAGGAFAGWGAVTGVLGDDWRAVGAGNVNPAAAGGAEVFLQQQSTGAIVYASIDGGATAWGMVAAGLTPEFELKAVADVNGDGAADAIVQNANTGAILFAAMQDGAFLGWGAVNQSLTSEWKAVGAGDINGDGCADVVVQQQSSGTTFYADMAGGQFSGWGVVSSSLTPDWEVAAVADVTGDGFAEVIFQNRAGGEGVRPGTTVFADLAGGAVAWGLVSDSLTGAWRAQGAADVDGDGFGDVLFQNTDAGTTYYAEMGASGFEKWGVVAAAITSDWHVV